MATLTFEVEVDEQTAERVRQSEEERTKIKYVVKKCYRLIPEST